MGVQNYLNAIVNGKGMAKSNTYAIYFSGDVITNRLGVSRGGLDSAVDGKNFNPSKVGQRILLMCDEVSLPGVQSSTGSVSGRYQGQGPVYYPVSPIYTDLQLSFMCDAEMQALKFLLDWHEYIYQTTTAKSNNKARKLKYPNEYQCNITIEKREKNATDEIGTLSLTYNLYNAWPYSVDAVPLSYGSSQLVKCTANFYYSSWDKK